MSVSGELKQLNNVKEWSSIWPKPAASEIKCLSTNNKTENQQAPRRPSSVGGLHPSSSGQDPSWSSPTDGGGYSWPHRVFRK